MVAKSPCIKKCELDNNNTCKGCYRTLEEIVRWSQLSEKQKQKIILRLKSKD